MSSTNYSRLTDGTTTSTYEFDFKKEHKYNSHQESQKHQDEDLSYVLNKSSLTNSSTYDKKNYVRVETLITIFAVLGMLSLSTIGVSTITYNRIRQLEKRVDNLYNNLNNQSLKPEHQQILQGKTIISQGISSMITAHPLCQTNYSYCMNLMHITTHFSTHNSSFHEINNGKYQIGNLDTFLINPDGTIGAYGPLFHTISNTNKMKEFKLPIINECDHYAHGVCIFEHKGKLMTYSHILFPKYMSDYHFGSNYSRRSFDDFFSYGTSGAGMGSAIGGGIGAIVGPEGIPVGAAIGGAVGAIVGGTIGAFQ